MSGTATAATVERNMLNDAVHRAAKSAFAKDDVLVWPEDLRCCRMLSGRKWRGGCGDRDRCTRERHVLDSGFCFDCV
eukprot:1793671-Rhodomonas_salina.4